MRPGAPGLPDFRTTPGRYMAELPPGTGTGSIMVHVWVPRSRAWVVVAASVELAYRIRPSGRTYMCGYSGMLKRALVNCVQVLVVGSYSSGISAMHVKHEIAPETTSTRPSGRVVAFGYHRGYAMGAAAIQDFVTGSNRLTSGIPTPPDVCPPTTSAVPLARRAGAAQKMLLALGT